MEKKVIEKKELIYLITIILLSGLLLAVAYESNQYIIKVQDYYAKLCPTTPATTIYTTAINLNTTFNLSRAIENFT